MEKNLKIYLYLFFRVSRISDICLRKKGYSCGRKGVVKISKFTFFYDVLVFYGSATRY
jgi:hypothetical protein